MNVFVPRIDFNGAHLKMKNVNRPLLTLSDVQ